MDSSGEVCTRSNESVALDDDMVIHGGTGVHHGVTTDDSIHPDHGHRTHLRANLDGCATEERRGGVNQRHGGHAEALGHRKGIRSGTIAPDPDSEFGVPGCPEPSQLVLQIPEAGEVTGVVLGDWIEKSGQLATSSTCQVGDDTRMVPPPDNEKRLHGGIVPIVRGDARTPMVLLDGCDRLLDWARPNARKVAL
jgi:hypothetical protein